MTSLSSNPHPASSINVLSGLVSIGANINLIDENGWSPLHLALKENKVELAEVLIQNGASVNDVNQDGSPLHIALRLENIEIVDLLIKN